MGYVVASYLVTVLVLAGYGLLLRRERDRLRAELRGEAGVPEVDARR